MESEHFLRRGFMHDGLVYGHLQVFLKYVAFLRSRTDCRASLVLNSNDDCHDSYRYILQWRTPYSVWYLSYISLITCTRKVNGDANTD